MSKIEEYLVLLQKVKDAEAAAEHTVNRIYHASAMLGGARGAGGFPQSWRDINAPGMPGVSLERSALRKTPGAITNIPDWPTQKEVYAAINAYWAAALEADRAYSALPPQQRDNVTAPPDYPKRR